VTLNIILLPVAASIAWWVSGFDPKLAGKDRVDSFFIRTFRCGLTLFLAFIFFDLPGAISTFAETMLTVATMALIWCGCLTELFALAFSRIVDPEDKRTFDPGKNLRDLDFIAELVKKGRKKQAIRLCRELKESGDANAYAVETLLEHLGVEQRGVSKIKPLTKAYLLRSQGKFKSAKNILISLLAKNPSDADAALMLIQIYARDMHRPGKAEKILQNLKKQPGVPPLQIESAERYIREWAGSGDKLKLTPASSSKSVDELLNSGYLGRAIEMLEQKTAAQPGNFELWIKFAEVQAVYCGNVHRADKIVQQIESNSGFSAKQIQAAKAKLQEWRNLA
jgi:tetratricopeptide (TPR) repeat protein